MYHNKHPISSFLETRKIVDFSMGKYIEKKNKMAQIGDFSGLFRVKIGVGKRGNNLQ